jgi:HAE1 family hydrophobic/amphiphilic exporter-1
MFIITMIVSGFIGLKSLKTELLPDFAIPVATINAPWVGASPEDVENLVTTKIEEAITGVDGMKRVSTFSYQDSSFTVIEFNYGEDIDKKVRDLQREVDNIKSELPADVDTVTVSDFDINASPVIEYYIHGDNLNELKNIAEDRIKPMLQKISGVGEVKINGGYEEEVLVEIDPIRAEAYNLTIMELYAILKNSNINLPLGVLADGGKEYVIRVLGELKTVEEVANVVVRNDNGRVVKLKDVATITPSFKDIESYARQDGMETLNISVIKTREGNVVDVAAEVRKTIEELQETLPSNLKFSLGLDKSEFINSSIGTVANNAVAGLILASIILFVFLKNIRATAIVALAIPTSIIGTFLLLSAKGISLNVISLMGLALGVGMLVDNSVVVLDNIFRHVEELDEDIVTGSANGASEMSVPIIASTATTVAVFLPLLIKEGLAKEIFQDMSYSIAFALLASLFVALTFVPMMSSKFLSVKKKVGSTGKIFDKVKHMYMKLLNVALNNKIKTIILTIILTVLLVVIGGKTLDFEMMPTTDEGTYGISVTLPKGLDVERSNEIALEIEEIVSADKFTKTYTSVIDKESISITVDVGEKKDRKESLYEIIAQIRGKFSHIRDAKFNIAIDSGRGGGRRSSGDVQVKVLGDNTDEVRRVSDQILREVRKIDGLTDIQSSFEGGNPQIQVSIDRVKAQNYGIRVADIVPLISTQVKGDESFTIAQKNREIDVTVRLSKEYRDSPGKLLDLKVSTPKGVIPLKEIGYINIEEGPAFIEKEDRMIKVTISANLDGLELRTANAKIAEIMENMELPKGVKYTMGGETEDMKETMADLIFALGIAIFLIYFILAAQFESFVLPFIIMGSVPLSVSGVIIGLIVTQYKFNIMVMVGIIMLAGIVVNNAIVLIDYINLLRAKGENLERAVRDSGSTRLRPILMTTLTTVFGMIPLALGIGDGSEIYQGMAIAVIFGLVFSTILTLVYIPVLYMLIENRKEKKKWKRDEKERKRRESLYKS